MGCPHTSPGWSSDVGLAVSRVTQTRATLALTGRAALHDDDCFPLLRITIRAIAKATLGLW